MWEGYELALTYYGNVMIAEWILRGCRNTMPLILVEEHPHDIPMPPWLGFPPFHDSHCSNLLRKNPEFYEDKLPRLVEPGLPYYWPTKEDSWRRAKNWEKRKPPPKH